MARKPIPDSDTLPVALGEWLDELAALGRRNDEGHTLKELCEMAGVSNRTMEMRLQAAAAAGRLVSGRRSGFRIDGLPKHTPVYRVLARPRR